MILTLLALPRVVVVGLLRIQLRFPVGISHRKCLSY